MFPDLDEEAKDQFKGIAMRFRLNEENCPRGDDDEC